MCTMKNDIFTVYADLSALLDEICSFLTSEVEYGRLTPQSSNIASVLIQKSKVQLQEISKVVSDNDSARYVDMHPPNDLEQNVEYINPDALPNSEPAEYHTPNIDVEEKQIKEDTCPFKSTPASMVSKGKCGNLDKRKTRFLGLNKKIYAAIHENWLLIYNSEKDSKPIATYNLCDYTAKQVEKKDNCFELISKDEEKTQYIAYTNKDMLQWIAFINKASGSCLEETEENTYEELKPSKNAPPPKETSIHFSSIKPKEKQSPIKPALPPKIPNGKLPLMPKEYKRSEVGKVEERGAGFSLILNNGAGNEVGNKPGPSVLESKYSPRSKESPTLISAQNDQQQQIEEEEEEIYATLEPDKPQMNQTAEEDEEEEIYDTLENNLNKTDQSKIEEDEIYVTIQSEHQIIQEKEIEATYDMIDQNGNSPPLEEYHEILESIEIIPDPPVKPKFFGRDKTKLRISQTDKPKLSMPFSFKSKK